jgi:hypothetical protein
MDTFLFNWKSRLGHLHVPLKAFGDLVDAFAFEGPLEIMTSKAGQVSDHSTRIGVELLLQLLIALGSPGENAF